MKPQFLRFKRNGGTAFPDWVERTLGSVFDWIGTNSLSREMLTAEPSAVQNIHYGDVHGKFPSRFKQSEQSAPFVKPEALAQPIRAEQFCLPGDVIIADASEDYADIGKSIEIIEAMPQSLVAGLHTHLARPKAGTLALGFSGYLFQTWALHSQIMRIAQGISVLGISKPNLSKLMVRLPHLDEQRRIATFLAAVDAKVSLLKRRRAALEQYKKGMMQRLFAQTLRFRRNDGTPFPDLVEKRLGHVADINPKSGPLPDEFEYIDLESVTNGQLAETQTILRDDAPERAQRVVRDGDILFQTVRPYQMNNLFFEHGDNYVASTGYAQIRPKMNARYLFQLLLTRPFVVDVIKRCTGTSYPAINSSDLASIPVRVPHPDEQRKIANFLSSLDDKIVAVSAQIDAMQTFKRGLLQQLFV